ncbi:DMT family transporter [Tardiphaga alba]|uniref:DMT family transporter n=2 Tax=Tardiphaga alba TaxID=340268 RepID=A0ABX8AEU9_9BRAD|nr:DMT family transporter [Tardiphaga alba]
MSGSQQTTTSLGIAFGAGAGALWGLVFLAPELVPAFSPLQLAAGRYLVYGAISALLIAPRWRQLCRKLSRGDWSALLWLGLAGNTLYYTLLTSAVQIGGIAMTSLVIGFLPVAVTIIGSRAAGAVPLGRLMPSLILCSAGAIMIGLEALQVPSAASQQQQLIGLLCAIGALVSWTCFAIGNSRALARLNDISASDWNLLTGVVTGAQSLVLIPLAILAGTVAHDALAWAQFAGVSIAIAVLASIVGNAFWNRMSRLLPLTMVGQMILFETLFALFYGYVWERRWPTLLESAAFAFVVLSVWTCIGAHQAHARRGRAVAGA